MEGSKCLSKDKLIEALEDFRQELVDMKERLDLLISSVGGLVLGVGVEEVFKESVNLSILGKEVSEKLDRMNGCIDVMLDDLGKL